MKSDQIYVVGIGASAGGLEPITELLREASCREDIAFVVVSHISWSLKNHLAQIFRKGFKY